MKEIKADAAHRQGWQIAEVVFGVPFLVALVAHLLSPYALLQDPFVLGIRLVGLVLIIVGLGIVIVTRREFRRYRQPTDPGHATDMLITTGPFARSRNPLYLASAFLFLGIALLMNALWPLLALLVSVLLCHFILIIPEEQYLTAKFGVEYQNYCATIHRWFGRREANSAE